MRGLSKVITKAMVLLLMITLLTGTGAQVAYAKSDMYQLNTEEVFLAVGGVEMVRVKGLQTPSSVVWSSADKSIATVNKGDIKGVSKGETVVTAKIGKVKLKCKVNVMWPNQKEIKYKDNISFTSDIYTKNTLWKLQTNKFAYEIQNNNGFAVTIKAQIVYVLDIFSRGYSKEASVTIPANDVGILLFDTTDKPDTPFSMGMRLNIISITKSKSTFLTSKVTVTDKQLKIGDNPVAPIELKVKNNSGKDKVKFYGYVMYYDRDGRFVGIERIVKTLKKGTTTVKTNPAKYLFNENYQSEFKDYTYEIYHVAYK